MNATTIVMLFWLGMHGGPGTIQGFSTMDNCRSAIIDVQAAYAGMMTQRFEAKCVEVKR